MNATHVLILAQSNAESAPKPGTVGLGLAIIGLILVLVMTLAYMWGKASAAKRAAKCPTCGAIRRGNFCSKCGTSL